jgi:hypothetical protein
MEGRFLLFVRVSSFMLVEDRCLVSGLYFSLNMLPMCHTYAIL